MILLLLVSFCGGNAETTPAIEPSTTSTGVTSTKHLQRLLLQLLFSGEEILASELKIGDCFNGNGAGGYYLDSAETFEKVPCDYPHEFEIVTSINYLSNTETDFNEEGVPNLEIYTQCDQVI